MEEREAEDAVNDFGRAAVGERKEEAVSLPPFQGSDHGTWLRSETTIFNRDEG